MQIIYDSREKPDAIRAILAEFERSGVEYIKQKLDVGDYINPERPGIVIDRKQSLGELCTNLCSPHDKGRFWRELKRAREQQIRLIVLCEHGHGIRKIEDVRNWKNPYGQVSGRDLMERIYRTHIGYGVEFLFCDKRETGKRIIELLGEDG